VTITDIVEYSKAKYKIFVDNEFAFVLYKGELRQLGIEKGETINSEVYNKVVHEIIPKRAKLRAMHLLEKRPYTEKAMRDKLEEALYQQETIDETIQYLKGFKYIDDKAYAIQYLDTYAESKTIKRIEQDLWIKGISRDVISDAIEQKRQDGELGDEEVMIKRLLAKKGFDIEDANKNEIAKIMRFLYGKGFSADTISRALRREF